MERAFPYRSEAEGEAALRIEDAARTVIGELAKRAEKRVGQRSHIDERMLAAVEQYHGLYDQGTRSRLEAQKHSSKIFINETRPKCNALLARLTDMLFPADDKCWSVEPTPDPTLTDEASEAVERAAQMRRDAVMAAEAEAPEAPMMAQQAAQAEDCATALRGRIDEAAKRATAMERRIEDQLVETGFGAAMRDMLADGIKLGTGILEGPIVGAAAKRSWRLDPMTGAYRLAGHRGAGVPALVRVDPWSWYPDMDATRLDECEGFLTRHLWNKQMMRRALKYGFSETALRDVMTMGPQRGEPSYLSRLRGATGETSTYEAMWHVWKWVGPLDGEMLLPLLQMAGDDALVDALWSGDVDPLAEVPVVCWFCQDRLLKLDPYPLESGAPLYSVFRLEPDEASVFGYGLPDIIREPQIALNAAWRMMLDNMALGAGPQIVVDRKRITPANGDWTLHGRKVWEWVEGGDGGDKPPFALFQIPTHQDECAALIGLAKQHIDAVTELRPEYEGEPGTAPQQTAFTTAMLMGSRNVLYRRIIKNVDDDVIEPSIARMYDWNMQDPDAPPEVKGDYEVKARGSSVLLVREMQTQNLMALAMNFAAHPVFGPLIKAHPLLSRIVAQLAPATEIVVTEDEARAMAERPNPQAEAMQAEAALKERELDFKEQALSAEVAKTHYEWDRRVKIAEMQLEEAMAELGERMGLEREKVRAEMQKMRDQTRSKERIAAVEVLDKRMTGSGAGGYV